MISDQWHPQNAHPPSSVAHQSPTVAKLPSPTNSAYPAAIDSHPKATQPFHHIGRLEEAMLKGLTPPAPIISHPEMEGYVARFQNLHGSEEARVDAQQPGARRLNINLFGMGVVEQSNIPELRLNIPLPTLGFNHGMIQCNPGNGASLHSLTAEEVFMPLIGPRAVTWLNEAGEQEIILQPSDCIHDPAGLYRGFRHVCEGRGTLLARIGGPDTGQASQEPGVLARAAAQGLSRNSEGEVQGFSS
jgi:hypothetical protein